MALSELNVESTQADMMQTIAAVELNRAQREVAKFFEIAYLQFADMPDVAREVRMTAYEARTQHLMTAGLMKKFTITADQIVGIMIPMIRDAVDLEDRETVINCFAQIIDMADNMKKEADDTQKRYNLIQKHVKMNLANFTEKNKTIIVEEKMRAIEMERENELHKATDFKERQLQDEKRKMDEELKTLQTDRDHMLTLSDDVDTAEGLREASAYLEDVDKQFSGIMQFWSSMAGILFYLKDDTNAGEVYLKRIENPKYADKFKKSEARNEQGWTNFGRICKDYTDESDAEINTVYAFLSASVPAAEHKKLLKQLMQGIKDDINNTYPQELAETEKFQTLDNLL